MNTKVDGKAKLIKRTNLSDKIVEFEFEMIEPVELDFIAGQYISIKVTDLARRSYSIASSPLHSKKLFTILIDITPNGIGTNYLLSLLIGDIISFIGQIGRFVLPDNLTKNLIFIATGTGIGPINSMLDTLVISQKWKEHNIYLYFGTSFIKDLIYDDKYNFYKYSEMIKTYKAGISREKDFPDLPFLYNGRVTDLIDELDSSIKNECQVFLCGNSEMIEAATGKLIFKGFKPAQFYDERYF